MPKPPKKLPYQGWNPIDHGVSQSLLQKFCVDTDRAHKHIVKGLREIDRKEAMEYGTIFHKLIEKAANLGSKYTRPKLVKVMSDWIKTNYPSTESILLAKIAVAQFHCYRDWETNKPKYKYIDAEPIFDEQFELPPVNFNPNDTIKITIPTGIKFRLRGRIDEVIDNNGMWIQENKTKSRIDISLVQDTIHENIQVMFYAVCSELKYGKPCKGVIYNIIRKPGLRQRNEESDDTYIDRIVEDIKKQPSYYFYRLSYEFHPGQIKTWIREGLLPLLYKVYIWWKSIEANPLQPWVDINGGINPFHGRKPFGIFDPMVQGKGDFYNLIVYGRSNGLIQTNELFPELQEEGD
jgi:hypothetical protein